MNLKNKRCGNCGQKAYKFENLKDLGKLPWKDYPNVFITKDLKLWICQNCNEHAITRGDARLIDNAVKESVCSQVGQFIDVIKAKSGLSLKEISKIIGISYVHLSNLKNGKKVPTYQTWAQLRMAARDPLSFIKAMNPEIDVRDENILLRA